MRALLVPSAILLISLLPSSVLAQDQRGAYGLPRDAYGNILVVPGSGQARGYVDESTLNGYSRAPRPAARSYYYQAQPGYMYQSQPIDPLVGYPYESPTTARPASNAVSLPSGNDLGDTRSPSYGIGSEYRRQTVNYRGGEQPGTIIIDTPTRHLYLIQDGGRAIRYGIGVGRPGFEWAGRKTVSAKREWPDWYPPKEMLKRRPDLPEHMDGGLDNPLGARALYLGSTLYRIHGTNEPDTIGHAVSSGCIRMLNRDVIDLYNRVPVGAPVVVI
ncbi:L,D-transpeptidase [Microvirga sp. 2MCAF38]|uniref:L,D-transpeptidase n=1 Tax=Microvirga sp. 2MCAF38 TaxID=3232989 RepID=UPI003F95E240